MQLSFPASSVGQVIAYSVFIAKNWRIYRIFHNPNQFEVSLIEFICELARCNGRLSILKFFYYFFLIYFLFFIYFFFILFSFLLEVSTNNFHYIYFLYM